MAHTFQFFSLVMAVILTGNELGTWAVVHPALRRLSLAEEVSAEQAITHRYGYFMPGVMLVTIMSGFLSAAILTGEAGRLVLAASLCYAAMLAITLIGNVPINVKTLQYAGPGDKEWRKLRRSWDRLHLVRILLDATGLALLVLAAID